MALAVLASPPTGLIPRDRVPEGTWLLGVAAITAVTRTAPGSASRAATRRATVLRSTPIRLAARAWLPVRTSSRKKRRCGLALFEWGPQGWSQTLAGEELAGRAGRVEENVLALARHVDARDPTWWSVRYGRIASATSGAISVLALKPR